MYNNFLLVNLVCLFILITMYINIKNIILEILIYITFFIIAFLMVHSYVKKKRIINNYIKDLEYILSDHLTHRLYVKQKDETTEFIFTVNKLIEKYEQADIEYKHQRTSNKRFLTNISHDMRTPLTSIIGYIELIKESNKLLNEEYEEYIDIIYRRSKDLNHMINQMFNVAKIESNELILEFELINLNIIIKEILADHYLKIHEAQMDLSLYVCDENCLILADRISIERILDNIINNAINYANEGKKLLVNLKKEGNNVILIICDFGPGISSTELENIYKRTFIIKGGKNSKRGSGFGLYITKALVEKNKGKIEIDSIPWRHTEIKIIFPAISRS